MNEQPDLGAPGLSILAAYTQLATMTGQIDDARIVKYNVESGTSMACPHAAGAAAYVKTFHPDWSPAAIKSALMTTGIYIIFSNFLLLLRLKLGLMSVFHSLSARAMKIKPIGAYLASGAGQIRPTKAVSPGLVFDIDTTDYISYLCKEGFNFSTLASLTGNKEDKCSKFPVAQGADGLNYPSMHLQLTSPSSSTFNAVFYRTVTYVGSGATVFKANIKSPPGVTVSVAPNILSFQQTNQKRSYKVVVSGKFLKGKSWYRAGSLVWKDHTHCVRSPILIYRPLQ